MVPQIDSFEKVWRANRPDIVPKGKVHQEWKLIDMAISADKNITSNKVEKLSKYWDSEINITWM